MNNIITAKLGQVGQKRRFSFSNDCYDIVEVLDDPKIKIFWNWDTGACPYCKGKITRNIEHDFYRIEVLRKEKKRNKECNENDIVLLGSTLDNRTMVIPKENYSQVFKKTREFKRFSS